jgi:hypothetical protein
VRRVRADEERVAVGLRAGDRRGADGADRPDPVLDHEALSQGVAEILANDACAGVAAAARREGNNEGDRPRRPALCGCAEGGERRR